MEVFTARSSTPDTNSVPNRELRRQTQTSSLFASCVDYDLLRDGLIGCRDNHSRPLVDAEVKVGLRQAVSPIIVPIQKVGPDQVLVPLVTFRP